MNQNLNNFINLFGNILKQGNPFPGQNVSIEVLINPVAGAFKNSRKLQNINKELENWQTAHPGKNSPGNINVQFHSTESMTHAQTKALTLIEDFTEEHWSSQKILILAGGDGFHKDICTAINNSSRKSMKNISIFRLPMGTGNDSSDCQSLSEACDILTGPAEIQKSNYLEVKAAEMPMDYCFNIASFGIDAYICELTEKWKRIIPGDIFKVMVDISVLFYDLKYPVKESRISWTNDEGDFHASGKKLLLLIAPKGHTTYGGHKKILPDSRNFLYTDMLSVPKRISMKGKFMKGTHLDLPEAHFDHADSLTVDYDHHLLLELDGEVIPLKPENFPVKISIIKDGLNILKKS